MCRWGSLNNKVKAVKIDGNEATVDNVKSGAYAVSRPFNIVTKDNMNDVAKDFVNFILSTDGQKIVEDNHYIPLDNATSFTSTKPSAKSQWGGSSSVSPVMEKLIEAYKKVNSGATIELQTTDSTTGVTSTVEGTYQIGMASRDLKDEEVAQGVKSTKIAIDGIAVIVNNENSIDNLSKVRSRASSPVKRPTGRLSANNPNHQRTSQNRWWRYRPTVSTAVCL